MASNSTATTTFSDLPSDILKRILGLLDAPSLAAISSTSSDLHSVASESQVWLQLSLSTFPSLRHPLILPYLSSSPHSFFSDAFLFPTPFFDRGSAAAADLPKKLISAVDIHNRGVHVFSHVIETDITSSRFRHLAFGIDIIMDNGKTKPIFVSPEDMTVSWILIDPASGRALNVSSRRAVAIKQYTVKFLIVGAKGKRAIGVEVAYNTDTGKVFEVCMRVKDVDGYCVGGEKAIRVLWGMMKEGRGRWEKEEELKGRYFKYLEWQRRKEAFWDMAARVFVIVLAALCELVCLFSS